MSANDLYYESLDFIKEHMPSEDYFNNRNFSKRAYWEKRNAKLAKYVFDKYYEYNNFFEISFSTFVKYYFLNEDLECYIDIEDFLKNTKHTQINKGTKKYKKYFNEAKKFINFEPKNFTEIFYCYRNKITDRPKCKNVCTNKTELYTSSIGYRKFCSQRCQLNYNNCIKEIKESEKDHDEIISILKSVPLDNRNLSNELVAGNYINIENYSKNIENLSVGERIYIFYHKLNFDDIKCKTCSKKKRFTSQGQGYKKTCGRNTCIHMQYRGETYYNENDINIRRNRGGSSYKSGFIYIMKEEEMYKIGIAQNPVSRLKEMSKIFPNIEYHTCVYLSDNLFKTEQNIHKKYSSENILFDSSFPGYTEFFNLTNEDLKDIREIIYENQ